MNLPIIYLWSLCGIAAYLVGSLPFGFLLARTKGVDIRRLGSGNIGATNVFRTVSKPLGLLAFLLDFAKGLCGVLLLPWLTGQLLGQPELAGSRALALFGGIMTVVGHNWTCFLGFKGGKGVATSAGMLLALTPPAVGVGLALWLVTFFTTRYVSLASIAAAISLALEATEDPAFLEEAIRANLTPDPEA